MGEKSSKMILVILHKIWAWLKKYWKWLLFPVGLIIGILTMIGRRKKITVTSPEVTEAEEARKKADEEARKRLQELEEDRREKIENIEKEHADTIRELTEDQRSRLEELREDPDELNEFLLEVGKEIRS
jgi:hypothetical protein